MFRLITAFSGYMMIIFFVAAILYYPLAKWLLRYSKVKNYMLVSVALTVSLVIVISCVRIYI
ncbi:hypothetical protein SHN02_04230 [Lacticaseibacillus paracasei]|nr:hypothetical protein SHN02_04230 [Lacticaseibacillus paracasei]